MSRVEDRMPDKNASNQSIEVEVKKPRMRFTLYIESVRASIIKDCFTLVMVVAIWAALDWLGASDSYLMGVLTVICGVLAFDQWIGGKTVRIHSVNPEDALDFIEQEIAEAKVEAMQKGTSI